jgi:hypothetical protein
MTRARIAVAATLTATALVSATVLAQQAPPMKSVLAGKKVVPPFRGDAVLEHTKPVTKREGNKVVTVITVRNLSGAPLARLRATETWYSADNQIVQSGQGTVEGLFQPNDIQTIRIETPWSDRMNANRLTFTHANGTVSKPRLVNKLEPAKEPAAVPAATQK